MIKKHIKTLIPATVLSLSPIVIGLILWDRLPEKIPIHFGIDGSPDQWGSKAFAVFVLPAFLAALEWLNCAITSADPKKNNIPEKTMKLVLWLIPCLSVLLSAFIYSTALGKEMRIPLVFCLPFGVLFVIIGNYMPKCPQNHTIGIKLPWTLESAENWNKTHRFAGKLWTVSGFAILLLCTVKNTTAMFIALLTILLADALVTALYSYMLYRKNR